MITGRLFLYFVFALSLLRPTFIEGCHRSVCVWVLMCTKGNFPTPGAGCRQGDDPDKRFGGGGSAAWWMIGHGHTLFTGKAWFKKLQTFAQSLKFLKQTSDFRVSISFLICILGSFWVSLWGSFWNYFLSSFWGLILSSFRQTTTCFWTFFVPGIPRDPGLNWAWIGPLNWAWIRAQKSLKKLIRAGRESRNRLRNWPNRDSVS